MKIQQTPPYNPKMGWNIIRQSTRYGREFIKTTEYYPNNGLKLLVSEKYYGGKLVQKVKTLFDKNWNLLKRKAKYLGGKYA